MLDAARRRAEGHPDAPLRPIPLEAVVAASTPPQRVRRLARLTMTAPPRTVYPHVEQAAAFNFTLVKFLGPLSALAPRLLAVRT